MRDKLIQIRCHPEEMDVIRQNAEQAGKRTAAFLRDLGLSYRGAGSLASQPSGEGRADSRLSASVAEPQSTGGQADEAEIRKVADQIASEKPTPEQLPGGSLIPHKSYEVHDPPKSFTKRVQLPIERQEKFEPLVKQLEAQGKKPKEAEELAARRLGL